MKRGWLLAAGVAAVVGVKWFLDWSCTQSIYNRLMWLSARQDRLDELWELFVADDEGVPS